MDAIQAESAQGLTSAEAGIGSPGSAQTIQPRGAGDRALRSCWSCLLIPWSSF